MQETGHLLIGLTSVVTPIGVAVYPSEICVLQASYSILCSNSLQVDAGFAMQQGARVYFWEISEAMLRTMYIESTTYGVALFSNLLPSPYKCTLF